MPQVGAVGDLAEEDRAPGATAAGRAGLVGQHQRRRSGRPRRRWRPGPATTATTSSRPLHSSDEAGEPDRADDARAGAGRPPAAAGGEQREQRRPPAAGRAGRRCRSRRGRCRPAPSTSCETTEAAQQRGEHPDDPAAAAAGSAAAGAPGRRRSTAPRWTATRSAGTGSCRRRRRSSRRSGRGSASWRRRAARSGRRATSDSRSETGAIRTKTAAVATTTTAAAGSSRRTRRA